MSETEMRLVERMIHEHLVHRVGTIRENLDFRSAAAEFKLHTRQIAYAPFIDLGLQLESIEI